MRRAIERFAKLASEDGFFSFQNSVVQSFYDSLGQGFGRNENEVALVKRLVDVVEGKSYGPAKLFARMLHGTRSYVEFNYLDKPVTKELGDMAVISIVTDGTIRLFQRTCIIQNKKSSAAGGWSIDPEQLFLLKNFPPFSGNKGIFRGHRDLFFRNASGCLGAFGLIEEPGEMCVISAPRLAACIHGKKSLSSSDLTLLEKQSGDRPEMGGFGSPFLFPSPISSKEWLWAMAEFLDRFGFPPFGWGGGSLPFLGNATVMRDLYEFVRSWSQLSVGEISCVRDVITNRSVDGFSNFLMRGAGLGHNIPIPFDEAFAQREFDGQMAVFVLHIEIE